MAALRVGELSFCSAAQWKMNLAHPPLLPLNAEPGEMTAVFSLFLNKKKLTSNEEGGPLVRRGGFLIICLLPDVDGCIADRATFFLRIGVVKVRPCGPFSISTSRRARQGDCRLFFLVLLNNKS